MSIIEHEDNRFTKENSEVEKYLLRIIQRYFDIESKLSKETIEAIIIESLTRFKQIALKEKGFLFSLNQKTGNINLTIQDFGGEQSFAKRSAFNKDFGNEADTICEGNDNRLSNARIPLEHVHSVLNIDNLRDRINNIIVSDRAVHIHDNKNVLDIIRYTGTQAQIDLIVIEELQIAMNNHYNVLSLKKNDIKDIHDRHLDFFTSYRTLIDVELDNARELVLSSMTLLGSVEYYANRKIEAMETSVLNSLIHYIPTQQIQSTLDLLKTVYFVAQDGEVPITNGPITCHPNLIELTRDGVEWGTTFVEEIINISIPVSGVNNLKAKFYFKYDDENGNEVTLPLPFFEQIGTRNISIEGSYNKSGRLKILCRHAIELPCYGNNDNIYTDSVIIESRNITDSYNVQYDNVITKLKESGCSLCLIDSDAKNSFVKNLLHDGKTYFIQGSNFSPEGSDFLDDEGNVMTYFNWDTGQPDNTGILNVIYINDSGKWAVPESIYTDLHGYVLEYKIKRFTDLYNNPRIYYQILGNGEVT